MKARLIDDGSDDTVVRVGRKTYRFNMYEVDWQGSYDEFIDFVLDDAMFQYGGKVS